MSVFRPYQKLVAISILGRPAAVPENNLLLRCFQFLAPDSIPYGAFCWNEECQNCRIQFRVRDDGKVRVGLSCKLLVAEGMTIIDMAPELRIHLRQLLEKGE